MRWRSALYGRSAMLMAALALATSCVPSDGTKGSVSMPPHPVTARQLLTDLALDVPTQVLPAAMGIATRAAALSPVAAAPAFLAGAQTSLDAARASECLTAAIYYEARSEPLDGQRAVAQVVLNRVRDRAFPHSVCGVVYQGVGRGRGCQFSFACDGSTARAIDRGAWDRVRQVAEAALAGSVYAPVGSATFYHTGAVSPWWAPTLARIGQIGAHIFYRWPSAMERALAFRDPYSGVEPVAVGQAAAPATMIAATYATSTDETGVTVHRGTTTIPAASVGAAVPSSTPAVRTMISAGVRIHVGGGMARHLVVSPVMTGGATVGEESDPI